MDTTQPSAETGAADSPSMDDTLAAAFDAMNAKDDAAPADVAAPTDDIPGDAGTEQVAAADDAESPDAETGTETPDAGSDGNAETEKPLDAPQSWSADDKEMFATLPRKAQEAVLRRESEREQFVAQKSQELASLKRDYEPVDRLIGPRKEAWAVNGFTVETGLNHLLSISDFASRDKAGFVRWYAQTHNLDLQALASDQGAIDPQIQALHQRLAQFETQERQRQEATVNQNRQSVKSAIDAFSADTKAHPHYAAVQSDMAAMIPSLAQANPGASHKELLDLAYQKAVWANPTTREKLQAEQKREADKAAAAAADKAKKAAGTNVRSTGTVPDGRRKLTMDETLALAYDQAQGRA